MCGLDIGKWVSWRFWFWVDTVSGWRFGHGGLLGRGLRVAGVGYGVLFVGGPAGDRVRKVGAAPGLGFQMGEFGLGIWKMGSGVCREKVETGFRVEVAGGGLS